MLWKNNDKSQMCEDRNSGTFSKLKNTSQFITFESNLEASASFMEGYQGNLAEQVNQDIDVFECMNPTSSAFCVDFI